jgi:hypothetical protein
VLSSDCSGVAGVSGMQRHYDTRTDRYMSLDGGTPCENEELEERNRPPTLALFPFERCKTFS